MSDSTPVFKSMQQVPCMFTQVRCKSLSKGKTLSRCYGVMVSAVSKGPQYRPPKATVIYCNFRMVKKLKSRTLINNFGKYIRIKVTVQIGVVFVLLYRNHNKTKHQVVGSYYIYTTELWRNVRNKKP